MTNRRDILVRAASASLVGVLGLSPEPVLAAGAKAGAAVGPAAEPPIEPVPFGAVSLEDRFWAPRLAVQRRTLVPFAMDKVRPAVENLRRTAAFQRGEAVALLPLPRYVSSDLYKVMEGAAYLLRLQRDPALEARMDAIIEVIEAAQRPDGYLYEDHIVGPPVGQELWGDNGCGDRPYSYEVQSHETYCMGHMYEAAVAYYQATGKDRWLKVAEKSARHINRVFFLGDPAYNGGRPVNQPPGHEEIELALAKLYRATGDRLYLDMAKRFLDIRGVTHVPHGVGLFAPTYAQQQVPVARQEQAVGHAVRAAYLYSGMAEVDALTGGREYEHALRSVWHDIVDAKMHITGGLGAVHGIEGFGPAFQLPNAEAYNETCAAVANVLFNMRLFRMTGDAAFADVAEIALYNNALAGTNLAGDRFFYVNPLESDGRTPFNDKAVERVPWFDTACCPSNLARLIPQVPGLMYGHDRNALLVTLYGASRTEVPLTSGRVGVEQRGGYPFDGLVEITLRPSAAQRFALKLRVPTWARSGRFVPGALYRFADGLPQPGWTVSVNGSPVPRILEKGFAVIERDWLPGDTVSLALAMPIRLSAAREEVEADRGRSAVTRGPLVYCAEDIDNDGHARARVLPAALRRDALAETFFRDGPLKGVLRLDLHGHTAVEPNTRMVPYYAWNNRGVGGMAVWLRRA